MDSSKKKNQKNKKNRQTHKQTNKQNMADLLTNATAITIRRERNAANSKMAELENLLLC